MGFLKENKRSCDLEMIIYQKLIVKIKNTQDSRLKCLLRQYCRKLHQFFCTPFQRFTRIFFFHELGMQKMKNLKPLWIKQTFFKTDFKSNLRIQLRGPLILLIIRLFNRILVNVPYSCLSAAFYQEKFRQKRAEMQKFGSRHLLRNDLYTPSDI